MNCDNVFIQPNIRFYFSQLFPIISTLKWQQPGTYTISSFRPFVLIVTGPHRNCKNDFQLERLIKFNSLDRREVSSATLKNAANAQTHRSGHKAIRFLVKFHIVEWNAKYSGQNYRFIYSRVLLLSALNKMEKY